VFCLRALGIGILMLPDLLSDAGFSWSETRVRLSDGKPIRSYQLRAAYKIFNGEPPTDPATGKKTLFLGGALIDWRDGVAIHIDPGLGKTIAALTAIVEWKKLGLLTKPVLVVAPIKVCETVWRQEAREWSHTQGLSFELIRGNEKRRAFAQKRPADIHLINPELLPWLQKYIRANWEDEYFALIIDESSMFKDNRAHRFRVLSNYGTRVLVKDPITGKAWQDPLTGLTKVIPAPRFKRVAVLTGTPSPSGLQNLWSPFYLLDHGVRLHRTFDTFRGRFFHKTRQVAAHTHQYGLNPEEDEVRPDWQVIQGGQERIHELIADITVELNADDYGVLPKQLPPVKHYVDLPDEILPFYRQLEKEAVFEMLKDPIIAANGGAKSQMCWQICNGALYATDDTGKKEWKELHTRKLDKLVELIDELDQHALIPYWFNHDRDRIVARFKKEGIPYAILNAKNAQQTIDRWNAGGIPNLLIHPQSAAHGLNLQFGGHTLIWFSTIWSLERWLQTIARLARSGQKEVVGIHLIMARNTTDDVRYNSLFEHGSEQARFRAATLKYQRTMGIDLGSIPELGNFQLQPFGGIQL
jgi:SNF2 family DNA or RNA helicase